MNKNKELNKAKFLATKYAGKRLILVDMNMSFMVGMELILLIV